jgi:long-chain acyl-CoA synthetase
VPDPIYGEEVAGFVVLCPGAALSNETIQAYCRSRLPAFKVPKSILIVDELPKNSRGKIDRNVLVALWADRLPNRQT